MAFSSIYYAYNLILQNCFNKNFNDNTNSDCSVLGNLDIGLSINVVSVSNGGVSVRSSIVLRFVKNLSNVSVSLFGAHEADVRRGLVFSDLLGRN